ncbi:hypothetical protein [Vibrio sp. B1Z05]|uniref:hypothetical protein n=1 Tax=Vibrio sp. B1Z05 TaxID=2654980 RepID=UPI00128BF7FC|nr:hypothetical protein [Vibrio sp. B1Z05]MPW37640.1 hypothetical protein [Vibrio sp. B1Z05]
MKFSVETLMSDHPELWQEVRLMKADKLGVLIQLMNGETFEPAGRNTATQQLDKEDAIISVLRLKWLMPITSVSTGVGSNKAHLIKLADLHCLLNDRSTQRKKIKRENAKRQEERTERNLELSIERYGIDWTLKRAKAVDRRMTKKSSSEFSKCSHCGYEQLSSDLFYAGCIKCGMFEQEKKARV